MVGPTSVDLAPELVASVRIASDPALSRELSRRFSRALREPAIWVTQLTDPRTAFYRLRHPLPPEPEAEARMERGRLWHEILERRLAPPAQREVRVARDGIIGQIDLFVDRPVEIKTTASPVPLERLATDRPEYLDQVAMYCALTDRSGGRLVIAAPARGAPGAGVTVVDLRFDRLDEIRRRMMAVADRLRGALDRGDPTGLPRCPWFDRGCAYRAARICPCTGTEAEDGLSVRDLPREQIADPAAAEEVAAVLTEAPSASSEPPGPGYRDLVYPRRAFFARTVPAPAAEPSPEPVPAPPAERSMFQLVREALESGVPGEVAGAVAESGAPDERVTLFQGDPTVLKTSRTRRPPLPGVIPQRHPWYVLELGLRCAAFGTPSGWLIVGYDLVPEEEGPVRVYRFRFDPLSAWTTEMGRRQTVLRRAFSERDPVALAACPDWMRADCPYQPHCASGDGCRVQR